MLHRKVALSDAYHQKRSYSSCMTAFDGKRSYSTCIEPIILKQLLEGFDHSHELLDREVQAVMASQMCNKSKNTVYLR